MHRLTNADADRLAHELRCAATELAAWSARHDDMASAYATWRSGEATYWRRRADEVRDMSEVLHALARALRDRRDLWSQ